MKGHLVRKITEIVRIQEGSQWVEKLGDAVFSSLMYRGQSPPVKRKKPCFFRHNSGGVLLSHRATPAVPLALIGLTSEFGMGSGVTLPTLPPNP